MKLIYYVCIFFPMVINAQQLSVKSFRKIDNHLGLPTIPTDQNGDICAIIKVISSEKGFFFDGDGNGIVAIEEKIGEYWVYVPYGSKFLTLRHDRLGVLRAYQYPLRIEKACIYEMIINNNVPKIYGKLNIRTKPSGADIKLNGVVYGVSPQVIDSLLPGTYILEVSKVGYKTITETLGIKGEEINELDTTLTASTETAEQYYKFGKYEEAYKFFNSLAQDGEPKALYYMGKFYEEGIVVDKNMAEAQRYYKLSSNKGNPDGREALMKFLAIEKNIDYDGLEDIRKKIEGNKLSANRKSKILIINNEAYVMFTEYKKGSKSGRWHVIDPTINKYTYVYTQDFEMETIKGIYKYDFRTRIWSACTLPYWDKVRADESYPAAHIKAKNIEQYKFEIWGEFIYIGKTRDENSYMDPITGKWKKSEKFSLEQIYFQMGTDAKSVGDIDRMVYYYIKAAEQGSLQAEYELGIWYLGKNDKKAIEYLEKAGEQGLYDAQLYLGRFYENDLTGTKDAEALYWYEKAVEKNNKLKVNIKSIKKRMK